MNFHRLYKGSKAPAKAMPEPLFAHMLKSNPITPAKSFGRPKTFAASYNARPTTSGRQISDPNSVAALNGNARISPMQMENGSISSNVLQTPLSERPDSSGLVAGQPASAPGF